MEKSEIKKKRYIVEVSELLGRAVNVMASSEEEAVEKANEKYNRQEIVLNADDFAGVSFSVRKERRTVSG